MFNLGKWPSNDTFRVLEYFKQIKIILLDDFFIRLVRQQCKLNSSDIYYFDFLNNEWPKYQHWKLETCHLPVTNIDVLQLNMVWMVLNFTHDFGSCDWPEGTRNRTLVMASSRLEVYGTIFWPVTIGEDIKISCQSKHKIDWKLKLGKRRSALAFLVYALILAWIVKTMTKPFCPCVWCFMLFHVRTVLNSVIQKIFSSFCYFLES